MNQECADYKAADHVHAVGDVESLSPGHLHHQALSERDEDPGHRVGRHVRGDLASSLTPFYDSTDDPQVAVAKLGRRGAQLVVAGDLPVSFSTGAQEPGPFSLADPERIRDLLGEGGIRIEPVEQRLRVGDDADDVLAFYRTQPMAKTCIQAAPAELAERVLEAIRAALVPHERAEGLFLDSAAWLVSAHR